MNSPFISNHLQNHYHSDSDSDSESDFELPEDPPILLRQTPHGDDLDWCWSHLRWPVRFDSRRRSKIMSIFFSERPPEHLHTMKWTRRIEVLRTRHLLQRWRDQRRYKSYRTTLENSNLIIKDLIPNIMQFI